MKKLMILLLLALSVALFGCGGEKDEVEVKAPEAKSVEVAGTPKTLALEWQRMIDEDGNVCCSSDATRMAVEAARAKLAEDLETSGIKVILLKTDFTPEECMEDPERANRILIAGRGLDYWLQAEVGSSPCEGFCKQALGGKGSCQNLIYEGETYEVIPAELIVKAGFAPPPTRRPSSPPASAMAVRARAPAHPLYPNAMPPASATAPHVPVRRRHAHARVSVTAPALRRRHAPAWANATAPAGPMRPPPRPRAAPTPRPAAGRAVSSESKNICQASF